MAICQSIRYTMGRNGKVPLSPLKHYMAICRSLRHSIGRNGNVTVSQFKHYMATCCFILKLWVGMAMCRSVLSNIMHGNMPVHTVYNMGRNSNVPISPSKHYLWQHACPYVMLWVEMAMCQSVHPNSIWQHAGPYIIVWVEMATCWSSH